MKTAQRVSQKKLTQEKEQHRPHKNHSTKSSSKVKKKSHGKTCRLQQVFPFKVDPEDLTIDYTHPKRRFVVKGNLQYEFKAKYKSIPVTLSCLYISQSKESTEKREAIYEYQVDMSKKLLACRGMNSYLTNFKTPMESQDTKSLKDGTIIPKKKDALCIIIPARDNVELRDYIANYENKLKDDVEPIHPIIFIQMAISLFAMLKDAHTQNIGLVNVSTESLKVGNDQTLYFDDFKSCVDLESKQPLGEMEWISYDKMTCPEKLEFKTTCYRKSADIYEAAFTLLQLIKKHPSKGQPLIKEKETSKITIHPGRIRKSHEKHIPILQKCLDHDPKNRPPAGDLLYWFERLRKESLSVA